MAADVGDPDHGQDSGQNDQALPAQRTPDHLLADHVDDDSDNCQDCQKGHLRASFASSLTLLHRYVAAALRTSPPSLICRVRFRVDSGLRRRLRGGSRTGLRSVTDQPTISPQASSTAILAGSRLAALTAQTATRHESQCARPHRRPRRPPYDIALGAPGSSRSPPDQLLAAALRHCTERGPYYLVIVATPVARRLLAARRKLRWIGWSRSASEHARHSLRRWSGSVQYHAHERDRS